MKINVVTPTLGRSAWLADTVASVRAHASIASHVLVAPNAEVAGLAKRFPQCVVIAEDNAGRGMYAAVNAGLAAVPDWDAFTYINDDDLLLPSFAGVVAAVAAARDQPFFAYGGVKLIDASGCRLGAIPVSRFPQDNQALYAQRLEPVYQHGTVISRAAWEQCGGFDQAFRFCGDSEFLARLCLRGVPAVRVSGEVAAFRLHQGQMTKNRPAMSAERTRVDQKLGLLVERRSLRHHWARLVFRTANLPVYLERIARHGFVSFDELLERGD